MLSGLSDTAFAVQSSLSRVLPIALSSASGLLLGRRVDSDHSVVKLFS